MAKYWVYINNQVKGPYEVDQLIRLPGFSRQTMVSVDQAGQGSGQWISPANIPDLARIFQKVDALHDAPVPSPRPAAKPARPRMPAKLTPVAPPAEEPRRYFGAWIWVILISAVIAGGLFRWYQIQQRQLRVEESHTAQNMVETVPLPPASQYSTIRQYLQNKQITPQWNLEHTPAGLYNVSLACSNPDKPGQVGVYLFETNLQAQSVRGLNTAAVRLLNEGFAAPASKTAAAPAPAKSKKNPADYFPSAINDRRQAFEQGDFDNVWETFSRRKQNEMEQGGISAVGFTRMQKLTFRPGSGVKQSIVKTKSESATVSLVLLKQTQPKHPDIYVKQTWVWEDDSWRLDDEEKRSAAAYAPGSSPESAEPPPAPPAPPAASAGDAPPAAKPHADSNSKPSKPIPTGLPGFSDLAN